MIIIIIALLGESASGKSTIEKEICKKYGYKRIVSYTTRPPRIGEKNGIDYYFVTNEDFNEMIENGYMVEHANYNGWQYGITKQDCRDDGVVVLTPHGLRNLKKITSADVYSFYINVPRRERLIQALKRGDDIDESIRRNLSDVGMFDGMEDEVDKVIFNNGYKKTPEDICNEIFDEIRRVRLY